ncbi:MAG: hypothetical protein WBK77_06510 [Alphaproteobacteria bacterium]
MRAPKKIEALFSQTNVSSQSIFLKLPKAQYPQPQNSNASKQTKTAKRNLPVAGAVPGTAACVAVRLQAEPSAVMEF